MRHAINRYNEITNHWDLGPWTKSTNFLLMFFFLLFFMLSIDVAGLSDGSKVEKFQENCQTALEEYTRVHYPGQGVRFGKLLLRLPSLKTINSQVIEKLFFFRLGKTSMDTFIHDMVHGGASNLWQPSYIPLQWWWPRLWAHRLRCNHHDHFGHL